jgi:hypothetical protein
MRDTDPSRLYRDQRNRQSDPEYRKGSDDRGEPHKFSEVLRHRYLFVTYHFHIPTLLGSL